MKININEKNIRIFFIVIVISWTIICLFVKMNDWISIPIFIVILLFAYIWLYRIEKRKREKHYNELSSRMISRLNKDLLNKK